MVICLERSADLHTAQLTLLPLTVSCFSKIHIGFTFLVPAHPGSHCVGAHPLCGALSHQGSPGQRAIIRVCVCVCVCMCACVSALFISNSTIHTVQQFTAWSVHGSDKVHVLCRELLMVSCNVVDNCVRNCCHSFHHCNDSKTRAPYVADCT